MLVGFKYICRFKPECFRFGSSRYGPILFMIAPVYLQELVGISKQRLLFYSFRIYSNIYLLCQARQSPNKIIHC